jgi:polysaccharide pyruvyl transferase WcaK-like protein
MKEAYLRGYYGYKNFGDELLFFGIVKRIIDTYGVEKLHVEVEQLPWIHHWIEKNAAFARGHEESFYLGKLHFVANIHHKHKLLGYIKTLFGRKHYRGMYRFFGGGEVLTDERKFPHDGRNIPLLFPYNVLRKNFTLLGGIALPHKMRTHFLYRILLPRAQHIILRDQNSLDTAQKRSAKAKLHEDFALVTIRKELRKQSPNLVYQDKNKYILVNINHQEFTTENIAKIRAFCAERPLHQVYFFPCDMKDDAKLYTQLKNYLPDLLHYDRTQHTVESTLSLFAHADAGIGCRLHFLLPLKVYGKEVQAIPYAEKINNMI